ncbi:MAG: cobalamin biosynthesis protein CobW [Rhodospirillaceae bacterium TMED8]|nr:cobalamin biosynthesis protein CobW [Magnetovibrio sp.]OUT50453.1 MAG: cobalamin biosynthesis protein CobW [Rhodospirillaceae bacterium TMED8]|tara:strand:+ start:792 stop:1817 length:1026 start_codon:yes stop_codon:yes gene_type:complete
MKIPTTVITGCLGAGKTTVIRHLLENVGDKRIALIINEFGDLGIDRELITGCDIEGCEDENIVELTNGCICCTVADDFLPTIEAFLDWPTPPNHIVIETSGLALPKPLVQAFNWPEIRSRVTVDGVVTIIDAPAVAEGRYASHPGAEKRQRESSDKLDHEAPLDEVFEDQLLCADLVLLNKADLIPKDSLEKVSKAISAKTHPAVTIIPTLRGAIDPGILLGLGATAEKFIECRHTHHEGDDAHDHDDFATFTASLKDISDPEDLVRRIKQVAIDHNILRVKGFVNVLGKEMRHVVQAVGPRFQSYYDRPWHADEFRCTELVIIGEAGLDQITIMQALNGD